MDLELLKEHCKKYPGVELHGKKIRIEFSYRGVRCKEGLNFQPTKANLKAAYNLRVAVLHEISVGTFDYAERFPNSKKAAQFSNTQKIPTVNEAMEKWLSIKEQTTAHSTFRAYKSKVRTHILPIWGMHRLDQIKPSELKKWVTIDLHHLANKTINETLIPFRGIYNDALADRIIKHSPFEFIDNLEVVSTDCDPFERSEIDKIANTATNRIQELNAFLFNCWTGLRLSELLALAWEDVDLNKGIIKVKRAVVRGNYKVPKTRESVRTINLIGPALDVLKKQKQYSFLSEKHEIDVIQEDNKTKVKQMVQFVFIHSLTGKPFRFGDKFRDGFFNTHIKKSGVRYRGPSQARHTFASQLLTAGINERWICVQMGHTSIKMLEKHYGKWMESEVPDMAQRVTKILGFSVQNTPIASQLK
ncbi:site-specific integrase [Pseudoalteromonas piratica]|uniref:site-specific integrase n=1 Tax=Pseudoalteromonas piratica TaxID=1348114 RepID=UPI00068D119A|nr:site-specific integrase [Pseudoalteromonas piratica]